MLLWICNRNSVVHRLMSLLAFTHHRELMKSVGKLVEKSLSYMLLLMVPKQVGGWHTGTVVHIAFVFYFAFCTFFNFCFLVLFLCFVVLSLEFLVAC